MRSAVNQGFPVNTVVSTANFLQVRTVRPQTFEETILTCPVPDSGSELATALLAHLEAGGQVLLYGPVTHGDRRILDLLDLSAGTPFAGEFGFHTSLAPDGIGTGEFPARLKMRELVSGGGAEAVLANSQAAVEVLAELEQDGEKRVFAAFHELEGGGKLGWVRGAFCAEVTRESPLPISDNPRELFCAERLMRWMLDKYALSLRFDKPSLETATPLILAARSRGAWFFSGFTPSTNTRLRWSLPHGVPVPVGCDVHIANGTGTMSLARAWHRECRVFVKQQAAGEVSCREHHSQEIGISRRLMLRGLQAAEVVFLRDTALNAPVRFQRNDAYLGRGTAVEVREIQPGYFQTETISGDLLISW